MSAVAIIQARLGSTRLPGKVLADIAGRPLLAHVVERVRAIHGVMPVVATVTKDFRQLSQVQAHVYCSHEAADEDVLGRYAGAAMFWPMWARHTSGVVMRLTGDCPLLAPEICARVLAAHRPGHLTTNASVPWLEPSGYPDGTDCDVFDLATLEQAAAEATDPQEREHVSLWMARHVPVQIVKADRAYPNVKLCVDTAEDLARVRQIYAHLEPGRFDLDSTIQAAQKGSE